MPKRIDLTNQKYGKLTVIEKADNIGDRTAWLCKCDCGNTKIIRTKELRNGIVKSCGCLRSEKSDIKIGDTFNRLTVLEKTDKRQDNSVVWKCQCVCGNIVERSTSNLHRVTFHSCGCYNKETLSNINKKDLTGKRFGKLIVLKENEKRTDSGKITWLCKCDCGTIVSIPTNSLTSGNTSSCGCINYSIGEKNIKNILDTNNISYKAQWSCPELELKRFDFAILDINKNVIRLIEFDGKQHFNDISGIWNSKESLTDIQKRDKIKNEYALSHNIPLVRIPYWERDNITLEMIMDDKYLVR